MKSVLKAIMLSNPGVSTRSGLERLQSKLSTCLPEGALAGLGG
jgi:hypothetical protein